MEQFEPYSQLEYLWYDRLEDLSLIILKKELPWVFYMRDLTWILDRIEPWQLNLWLKHMNYLEWPEELQEIIVHYATVIY